MHCVAGVSLHDIRHPVLSPLCDTWILVTADFEGDAYALQLHEQLPWIPGADGSMDSSSSGIPFDSHCVANFFISFRPLLGELQANQPPPLSSTASSCRIRFFFAVGSEEQQQADSERDAMPLPALLSLEVTLPTQNFQQTRKGGHGA